MTGERVIALFSALALQFAGLAVLFFWTIGLVLLQTGNGGQINDLSLNGLARNLFYLYPLLLLLCSILGWLLYYLRRDIVANMALAAPVGLLVLYYLVLIY